MKSLHTPHIIAIIPLHDVAIFVDKCIASILSQTQGKIPFTQSIIVVDDASSDTSLARASKALRASSLPYALLALRKNMGASVARNTALSFIDANLAGKGFVNPALDTAKCEFYKKEEIGGYAKSQEELKNLFIQFLDGDDFLDTSTFAVCLEGLASHKGARVVSYAYTYDALDEGALKKGRLRVRHSHTDDLFYKTYKAARRELKRQDAALCDKDQIATSMANKANRPMGLDRSELKELDFSTPISPSDIRPYLASIVLMSNAIFPYHLLSPELFAPTDATISHAISPKKAQPATNLPKKTALKKTAPSQKNIRFKAGIIGEDHIFGMDVFDALGTTKSLLVIKEPFYHYHQYTGSACDASKNSFARIMTRALSRDGGGGKAGLHRPTHMSYYKAS